MSEVTLTPEAVEAVAEAVARKLCAERSRLVDAAELADRLGVCRRSVDEFRRRGEIPEGLLIGTTRRWRWEDVLRHLGARRGRRRRKKGRES